MAMILVAGVDEEQPSKLQLGLPDAADHPAPLQPVVGKYKDQAIRGQYFPTIKQVSSIWRLVGEGGEVLSILLLVRNPFHYFGPSNIRPGPEVRPPKLASK